MQIYLARNQVQAGPYTLTELNNMLAAGKVELSDLMWHEGMQQWQPVGEITQGQFSYSPNSDTPVTNRFTNNRATVADLYGNKDPEKITPHKAASKASVSLSKPSGTKIQRGTGSKADNNAIASISNRILAGLIDTMLLIACYIPFLSGLNFDRSKLPTDLDMNQIRLVSEQMVESVPAHLSTMTTIMFFALLVIQLILLAKKGQSIGKLAVGIHIVDVKTKEKPATFNLLFIRTLLPIAFYFIPIVGPILMLLDFIVMIFNKQRRSIHDFLAKTIVVKPTVEKQQRSK